MEIPFFIEVLVYNKQATQQQLRDRKTLVVTFNVYRDVVLLFDGMFLDKTTPLPELFSSLDFTNGFQTRISIRMP